jgi:UPF0716 protein FxsA
MRFVVLAILLGFPALDLYATLRFSTWTGVPIWIWLGISVASGLLLLRSERTAFRARTVAALHGEEPLLRGIVDSGRKVLAGFLLLMPGIASDLIALALLLLPINLGNRFGPQPAAAARPRAGTGAEAIEGTYRRVD